jgi:hypothetical protein
MATWTQADWTPNSDGRKRLFAFVADALNWSAGRLEFMVKDDVTGPLIRHVPTEVRIGVRPSMPANDAKPFDVWVRLTHRFPMKLNGEFNQKLCLQRIREVADLRYPEL